MDPTAHDCRKPFARIHNPGKWPIKNLDLKKPALSGRYHAEPLIGGRHVDRFGKGRDPGRQHKENLKAVHDGFVRERSPARPSPILTRRCNVNPRPIDNTMVRTIVKAMLLPKRRHLAFGLNDWRGEQIAAAAHGLDDRGFLGIFFDPPAQPADVHVDAAVEGRCGPAARDVEELIAGQHALRPLDERQQDVELGCPQVHERTGGRVQPPARDVEAPAEELKDVAGAGRRAWCRQGCASQNRANAS